MKNQKKMLQSLMREDSMERINSLWFSSWSEMDGESSEGEKKYELATWLASAWTRDESKSGRYGWSSGNEYGSSFQGWGAAYQNERPVMLTTDEHWYI